ncbi:MAG: alpha/beta hydrolase [Gemmatimonadaceae bacterium]
MATTTRPEYYAYLRAIGVNILAFDWRGFGASEGTPSEKGLYRDATAAYEYLRITQRVPAESVVIFGHSLGTAPAVELATRVTAAALVIEGAPRSVSGRAQELYPYLPVRLVASSHFNSIGRTGSVKMPILFLHAREDSRIPLAHGRALFDSAKAPKRFVELAGRHHDAFLADSAKYFGEYARFVTEVRQRQF